MKRETPGRPSPFKTSWRERANRQLCIRIPASFVDLLEKRATEQGTTVSSLVRFTLLRDLLGETEAERLEPEIIRHPGRRSATLFVKYPEDDIGT